MQSSPPGFTVQVKVKRCVHGGTSHRGTPAEFPARFRCSGRFSPPSPSVCSPARSWSARRCPGWTPPPGGCRARARRGLHTGRQSRLQKTKQFGSAGERQLSKFKNLLQSRYIWRGRQPWSFQVDSQFHRTPNSKTAALPLFILGGAGQHEISSSCLRKSVKP